MPVSKIKYSLRKRNKSTWRLSKTKQGDWLRRAVSNQPTGPTI